MPQCGNQLCACIYDDKCKFCPECGQKAGPLRCSNVTCNIEVSCDQKFCAECGTRCMSSPASSTTAIHSSPASVSKDQGSTSVSESRSEASSADLFSISACCDLAGSSSPETIYIADPNWASKFSGLNLDFCITTDVSRALNSGKRLYPKQRRKLVGQIIDYIRAKFCSHPTKKDLELVAHVIVQAYPNSGLGDVEDGVTVGTGYDGLCRSLILRRDNSNRDGNVRNLKRKFVEDQTKSPTKKRPTDSYGCVNWGPACEDEEKLEQMKKSMKSNQERSLEEADVREEFLGTYALQRKEINANSPIGDLMKDWPLLFSVKGFLLHFNQLVGIEIPERVKVELQKKIPRLEKYFKGKSTSNKAKKLLLEMEKISATTGMSSAVPAGTLLLIMDYFGEDESTLFQVVEETLTVNEIEDTHAVAMKTPTLICCGESVMLAKHYHIQIDGRLVITYVTTFAMAISIFFASFYILNIHYPAEAANTMDFIQRYLVRINPKGGSKVERKGKGKVHTTACPKVLKVFREMFDYEMDLQN